MLAFATVMPFRLSGQAFPASVRLRPLAFTDSVLLGGIRLTRARAHVLRWPEVLVVAGSVVLSATADEPIQRWTQRHRSATLDDLANLLRQGGELVPVAGLGVGLVAAGLATDHDGVGRAGGRILVSVLVAGMATTSMKYLIGRSRPNDELGAFAFHPFTNGKDAEGDDTRLSLPSEHTVVAFVVATSLADDIHSPAADVLLYTAAAGTAWSRLNDNRHWLSDTALGAAIGITTAKLVDGHWRVFGLHPPRFLVAPSGAAVVDWRVAF
jgi:membrane-associated phospholipid phosphatase